MKRHGKGGKSSTKNDNEAWNLQDMQDHLPTTHTSSSSGSSSKVGQRSGKKPVEDQEAGVKSYTTIMGFCIDDKLGVICADSRINYHGGTFSDTAKKVAKVSNNIAIVGSGDQPIFDDVKKRLVDLNQIIAMVVSVEDAVKCIKKIVQRCVEQNVKINPQDKHVVDYIVIGKVANKLEMYRIHNSHDSMNVDYFKASTRIMNGGSGAGPLEAYQKKNKKNAPWVKEIEAVRYCFKCMMEALQLDAASGGSIIMYSINIEDDEGLKLHAFPESDVFGHMLETDAEKARLLV